MAAKLCEILQRGPHTISEATILSACCARPVIGLPGRAGVIEWRCSCKNVILMDHETDYSERWRRAIRFFGSRDAWDCLQRVEVERGGAKCLKLAE